MKPIVFFFMSIVITQLTGCASSEIRNQDYKSYRVGSTVTANIGSPFLISQTGTVRTVKQWVGVLYSEDGWSTKDEYSQDFIRKELIYSGIAGNTIDVTYREYRNQLAAQAFYQSVKYDLNESKIIAFQNFTFKVIEANNSRITIQILSD
ncbi:hypothetical protein [Vibrio fluvialis]|uniref:hypothetical protein n=1 Tax=Vibrio fluvialis TaxID=676 RepID=UPI001EEC16C7|nr:hypothetical protein [Vibrio fluvialis]MCG6398851.1 hypothetical protein [Vibrio fluvialis]